MNKGKQAVVVAFFLCLIFAIAVMPLFFLEYQNKKMLNRIETTALQIDGDEQEISAGGDIFDRILIIQNAMVEGREALVGWPQSSVSEERKKEIIGNVKEQLNILQEKRAIHGFSFAEENRAAVIKRTFLDMQNPNYPINVWSISLDYPDFVVDAFMDSETSALYEVSILSKNGDFTYDAQDISKEGFLEYLKSFSESLYKGDERFDAKWYYGENEIGLYITSYNDKANIMTSYSFKNDSDYATVTGIWEKVGAASE